MSSLMLQTEKEKHPLGLYMNFPFLSCCFTVSNRSQDPLVEWMSRILELVAVLLGSGVCRDLMGQQKVTFSYPNFSSLLLILVFFLLICLSINLVQV